MMEIKDLTEWFPADVKPNFIGVYEVEYSFGRWYAWWSGSGWLLAYYEPHRAYEARNTDPLSKKQNKRWRGLARPIE